VSCIVCMGLRKRCWLIFVWHKRVVHMDRQLRGVRDALRMLLICVNFRILMFISEQIFVHCGNIPSKKSHAHMLSLVNIHMHAQD
jgi:hypothetical protein